MKFEVGDHFCKCNENKKSIFMIKGITMTGNGELTFDLCPVATSWVQSENELLSSCVNYYKSITVRYEDLFTYFDSMDRVSYGYIIDERHVVGREQPRVSARREFFIEKYNLAH